VLAAARWVVRRAGALGLLAAALGAPPAARGAVPIALETVSQPAQLMGAVLPLTSDYAQVPFRPPENLEFEVKWGILSVGTSNLQSKEVVDFNGRPAFHIVSEAHSSGFCDTFYKVRDLNESWMDAVSLDSLGYNKQLREGKFFRDEWVLFDYANKRFASKTTNKDNEIKVATGTIAGPVQDILSSMYLLRSKDLQVGTEILLDVNTKKNWPLVVKVLRKKRITVPAGTFDTLEIEPFLRDEGIFIQKGKRLQVWLTDDARKIPVRLSVEVFFGNVTASLTKIGK